VNDEAARVNEEPAGVNTGAETVNIGGTDYTLGRISARRGLTAASLIIPHISALKPILEAAAALPQGKRTTPRHGITILMDAINVLAPLLDPDTFLEIASAVTGVPPDALGDAPLEDVLDASIKGLARLDLVRIIQAVMGLFAHAGQLAGAQGA